MWQLGVLFFAPLFQNNSNLKATVELNSLEFDQIDSTQDVFDSSTSGYFVEEILEEEVHPSESTSFVLLPWEEIQYADHKLTPYQTNLTTYFLPPELTI